MTVTYALLAMPLIFLKNLGSTFNLRKEATIDSLSVHVVIYMAGLVLLLLFVSLFMDCPLANSFRLLRLCHFDVCEGGHWGFNNHIVIGINIIIGTGRRIVCGICRRILRRRVHRRVSCREEAPWSVCRDEFLALDGTVIMLNNIGTARARLEKWRDRSSSFMTYWRHSIYRLDFTLDRIAGRSSIVLPDAGRYFHCKNYYDRYRSTAGQLLCTTMLVNKQ